MSRAHTPGPWTADSLGFVYARADAGLPDRSNNGAALVLARAGSHALPRDLALMAAAPGMLAVLQEFLSWRDLAIRTPDMCGAGHAAYIKTLTTMARDAIDEVGP